MPLICFPGRGADPFARKFCLGRGRDPLSPDAFLQGESHPLPPVNVLAGGFAPCLDLIVDKGNTLPVSLSAEGCVSLFRLVFDKKLTLWIYERN